MADAKDTTAEVPPKAPLQPKPPKPPKLKPPKPPPKPKRTQPRGAGASGDVAASVSEPSQRSRNLNALRQVDGLHAVEVRTCEEAADAVRAAVSARRTAVVLLTGPARCGKSRSCAEALRSLGMRARQVDLLEPQSMQSLAATGGGGGVGVGGEADRGGHGQGRRTAAAEKDKGGGGGGASSCEALGKYNWCGDALKCAVVVEDIDAAFAVLGQPCQASLLTLLQRTERAGQPVVMTSTEPEPLTGSGRTVRAIAQLVSTSVSFAAPSSASDESDASDASDASEKQGKKRIQPSGNNNKTPSARGILDAILLIESYASSIESNDTALLLEISGALRRRRGAEEEQE